MKLKKIASLMLAGIMAVSMLAGCKTADNNGEEENPVVPVASDAVTYANDALGAKEKEVMTFSGNTELDALLKKVATNPDNFDSNAIEAVSGNYNLNSSLTGQQNSYDLHSKVNDGLTGQRSTLFNAFDDAPVDKVSQKVVVTAVVSGNMEEKAAVQMFVDAYAGYFDTEFPDAITGDYACDYAGEISVVKVASPEHSDKTAWVMAIVATQTVTATANA